jgi:hypothetical protein
MDTALMLIVMRDVTWYRFKHPTSRFLVELELSGYFLPRMIPTSYSSFSSSFLQCLEWPLARLQLLSLQQTLPNHKAERYQRDIGSGA